MYSIFFHVSGISIVEICFFFIYIGPLETKLFEKIINKILKPPLNKITTTIHSTIPSNIYYTQEFLKVFWDLNDFNVTTTENDLLNKRNIAIEKRDNFNNNLFLTTIELWAIIVICLLFIYIVHRKCIYLGNKKKKNNIDSEINDIEMQSVIRYRKGSDNEEGIQGLDTKYKNIKNISYNSTYYLLLTLFILLFQYVFFEHIVLNYDPLSVDEVQYLLYLLMKPNLKELGVI